MDFRTARVGFVAAAFAVFAWPAWPQGPANAEALGALIAKRLQAEPHSTCVGAAVVEASARASVACSGEAAHAPPGAIYEIGTLSRVFAGLLLADMVERGEVSLDDPASKYAPAGAKLPSRPGPAITLRHLVTHTAALPDLPDGFQPREFLKRVAGGDHAALYEVLAGVQLSRPVGGDAEPSQLGYLWLADLLARRGGERYDRLVAQRVLLPLGTVGITVLLTVGAMSLTSVPLDLLTNMIPPLLVTIGLAEAVHMVLRYEDELPLAGGDRELAAIATLRHTWLACFVTTFTTAIGFGALALSDTEALRRFGVVAGLAAGVVELAGGCRTA